MISLILLVFFVYYGIPFIIDMLVLLVLFIVRIFPRSGAGAPS
jgi:hypothetical protein